MSGAALAIGRGGGQPPFAHNKENFLTEKLLFYVSKPIQRNGLSEVLYKIQQIECYEEASALFVSIN